MKEINLSNWRDRLREEFQDDTFSVKAGEEEIFLAVRVTVLEYFIEEVIRATVRNLNTRNNEFTARNS